MSLSPLPRQSNEDLRVPPKSATSQALEAWLPLKAKISSLHAQAQEYGKRTPREALALAKQGIELLLPHSESLPQELVIALCLQGALYTGRDNFTAAARSCERALEIIKTGAVSDTSLEASVYSDLAYALRAEGEGQKSEQALERALDLFQATRGNPPALEDPASLQGVAPPSRSEAASKASLETLLRYAEACEFSEAFNEAAKVYSRAAALATKDFGEFSPQRFLCLVQQSDLAVHMESYEEGTRFLDAASELAPHLSGPPAAHRACLAIRRIRVAHCSRRYEQAVAIALEELSTGDLFKDEFAGMLRELVKRTIPAFSRLNGVEPITRLLALFPPVQDSPLHLELCLDLLAAQARNQLRAGDTADARSTHRHAVALADKCLSQDHWISMRARLRRAHFEKLAGNTNNQLKDLAKIAECAERVYGKFNHGHLCAINDYAEALLSARQPERAQELLEPVYESRAQFSQKEPGHTIQICDSLADIAGQQDREDDAIAFQEEALLIGSQAGGRVLADAQYNASITFLDCDRPEQASKLVQAAFEYYSTRASPPPIVLADCQAMLGACSLELGHYDTASTQLKVAAETMQELGLKKDPRYASIMIDLGACFLKQAEALPEFDHQKRDKLLSRSESALRRADKILWLTGDTRSNAYCKIAFLLGEVAEARGEQELAQRHRKQLELREAARDADSQGGA